MRIRSGSAPAPRCPPPRRPWRRLRRAGAARAGGCRRRPGHRPQHRVPRPPPSRGSPGPRGCPRPRRGAGPWPARRPVRRRARQGAELLVHRRAAKLGPLEGGERVDALPRARTEVPDGGEEPAVEVALRPQERGVEPRSPEELAPSQADHCSWSGSEAARGSITPLLFCSSRASSASCWRGPYGKASRTCSIKAGWRLARTPRANEPGSLLRMTRASRSGVGRGPPSEWWAAFSAMPRAFRLPLTRLRPSGPSSGWPRPRAPTVRVRPKCSTSSVRRNAAISAWSAPRRSLPGGCEHAVVLVGHLVGDADRVPLVEELPQVLLGQTGSGSHGCRMPPERAGTAPLLCLRPRQAACG